MQQSPAIYNPLVSSTPSQLLLHAQRIARAERIKALAFVESPKVQPVAIAEPDPVVRHYPFIIPSVWYQNMWFYDLVDFGERWHPGLIKNRPLRIEEIQRACAKHYGVTVRDMISARRTAAIVLPRQVGYFLAKALTLRSLPEIGRRFGGRDHSTALSGIRKIDLLRKTDARLESDLQEITRSLVGGSLV